MDNYMNLDMYDNLAEAYPDVYYEGWYVADMSANDYSDNSHPTWATYSVGCAMIASLLTGH